MNQPATSDAEADSGVAEVTAAVNSALASLERLPSQGMAEHVAVYEDVHKVLSDALSAVDET